MNFEDFDWAPPDVELEELVARFYEICQPFPHMQSTASIPRDCDRALARWILKYWTLRFPDGGLPLA